jgi:hypothetical protein
MAVTLWRVDVYYPVTGVYSSTVHSGGTRDEAVHKALQYVPYALLEAHEYPHVKRVCVDSLYRGNPHDLVI